MKLIMERWNRFMVEADFVDSPDEDQPGKNALIVFSPQESYTVAGNTHGGLSHTIKHYKEFEPSEVATALSQALAQAKESNNFAIQNLKTGATVTGDEAKNSNSANENAMLNTFDMINDKLQNGQSLTQEEEQIKSFLEPINTKYQSLVDTYMSQATDVDNLQDPAQIKQLLDAGKLIKFVGTYSGSPYEYFFNPQDTGLVASQDGKVATLFRIDKRGNNLGKVVGYFNRGVELQNAALQQALSAGAETTQQAQPQATQQAQQAPPQQQKKKRPNPRAMAMGMARGGKTPEEIQAQIKKSIGIDISVDNIKAMIGA